LLFVWSTSISNEIVSSVVSTTGSCSVALLIVSPACFDHCSTGREQLESLLHEVFALSAQGTVSVFTQGVVWGVNSFDQWGVEYGKQIARLVLPKLLNNEKITQFDSSTNNLINYTKNNT
jgi:H+/gluconate symporter-like permease